MKTNLTKSKILRCLSWFNFQDLSVLLLKDKSDSKKADIETIYTVTIRNGIHFKMEYENKNIFILAELY